MPIFPLSSTQVSLQLAGGKGENLARLAGSGLNVPRGFIIPTQAYRAFIAENALQGIIQSALNGLSADKLEGLDQAAGTIRTAFSLGKMSSETAAEILTAYADLGSGPVAVRSSATTEDLPELSFAGQQDTYLNVIGNTQLLKAVIDCWGSLWTSRAIGYRLRNAVSHADLALAVVVQVMVPSKVSGVLFTANPLTGLLSESVIDATFGLGDALVSGKVEPDQFIVDSSSGDIKTFSLGAKKLSTRTLISGGIECIEEDAAARQTLDQDKIRQLVAIGQKIQSMFNRPQDIEWAIADEKLYVLQSRAITSLFPVPAVSFDPLIVWFSFGAVQGLMGPLTPLGREAIFRVVIGAGRLFGKKLRLEDVDLFVPSGERIWVKMSDVIHHPLGFRVFNGFLGFIEPSIRQIIQSLIGDPRMQAGRGKLKFSTLQRLMRFFFPIALNAIGTMLHPQKARVSFDKAIWEYLNSVKIKPGRDRFERLANFAAFMQAQGGVADALPFILPRFLSIFGPAMASLNLLGHLVPGKVGQHGFSMLALEVTRALPGNVTTLMDLALWKTAISLRTDVPSLDIFHKSDARQLAVLYLNGALPPIGQKAVAEFMQQYGMRGIGEIDLGQKRWREDPTPVMQSLQSYLQIDSENAPDALFIKGEKAAHRAVEELAAEACRQRGGWIKEKLVRAAANRVRLLMGARETPKFIAVQAMGIVRAALLEIGREFSTEGAIEKPEDLFFLQVSELEALSRKELRDWKTLVASRRQAYAREQRRKQVPRVILSDGRAFYKGLGAETDTGATISGSPVSPGAVEGVVHVVFDPHQAQLAQGEILVCPGTDPAWTPLFMTAAGLITEVGGMMTHGSVVAREFGIPAVVGVHQATTRLKNGQKIRLDGTAGKIYILDS